MIARCDRINRLRFGVRVPAIGSSSTFAVPDIDLKEYLRILWRQKRVILAVVIAIMALAIVILSSLTPRYTATVFVEINSRQSQVVDFEAVLSGLPADSETIQTEIRIIQSRKIAERTIARLELNRTPEFNSALRPIGLIASWQQSIAAWLTSLAGNTDGDGQEPVEDAQRGGIANLVLKLASILSPSRNDMLSQEAAIKRENDRTIDNFLGKLTVAPEGRSRIVRISFQSESPETATEAANTTADFYIVAQLEAKFEATKRATTWLGERIEQLRVEVETKERIIEEFRAKSGLLQGGQNSTLTSEQVSDLNAQHVLELAGLAAAEARLRQVNKLLKSPKGIESAVEVLQSPLIRDFRRDESRVEREVAELSEEYGERHPRMINARANLRDLRARIKIEVDRIVQGLRNEVAVARARAASVARSLGAVKTQVAKLNKLEVRLRALEREATASRTLLENLLQRSKQTVSQESFQQADANIVSYASVPDKPSFPKKGVLLPLIFAGAIFLGVILALAVEKLDLGFRSAEQIERFMDVTPLGLIPMVSKIKTIGKGAHDYVLENPESAFGEAIRSLYTNILLSDVARRPKVILVTSALPREGKTTVVLSLARMLATVGQKVIVVDCDLRRPTVHKALGIPSGPGLTECLTEGTPVEEVLQEDKESGAHILRAGTPVQNAPDQLDSGAMQKLLKNLGRKYDIVILDSAPILAVSDTLFVSRLADKTIYLVRWARTRRETAGLGLKRILAAKADVAGALLTMVDVKAHAQYGYGDSGTYYGTLKKYYTG